MPLTFFRKCPQRKDFFFPLDKFPVRPIKTSLTNGVFQGTSQMMSILWVWGFAGAPFSFSWRFSHFSWRCPLDCCRPIINFHGSDNKVDLASSAQNAHSFFSLLIHKVDYITLTEIFVRDLHSISLTCFLLDLENSS